MQYHLSIGAHLLLWVFPVTILILLAIHATVTARRELSG